jgi:superfamily II DNA or RNA helicase
MDLTKKHQLEAINVIENYLTGTDITKHAMIKIPTGAGKTGIIAIVANFYPNYSNVLILVPNAALPQQTKEEIDRHFWNNIDVDADELNLKPSYLYKNITKFIENQDASGSIIILTIQRLSSIYRNNSPLYQELQEKINLVIFDEGHREPAKEWSDINRELSKKTILFTAVRRQVK